MPDDYLTAAARPGCTIRRDTAVPYVTLDLACMARDEANGHGLQRL